MKLEFLGFSHTPLFLHGSLPPWGPGEIRTINSPLAEKLLSDYPENFREIKPQRRRRKTTAKK